MARTMVANLTGARLREVDEALRDARGGEAIDTLMKEHPYEVRTLQHLFDERRAGRPVANLARINRVMIWSDGAMEFRVQAGVSVDGSIPAGLPAGGPGRSRDLWVGTARPVAVPRTRPASDDSQDWSDAPVGGEGWDVVRPGKSLPIDPDAPEAKHRAT